MSDFPAYDFASGLYPCFGRPISQRWYTLGGYTGISSWSLTREYAFQFQCAPGSRFDAIGARSESPVTAGNSVIAAIRAPSLDGLPGKVLISAVLDFGTSGFKQAAIEFEMPYPFVWLTATPQGVADPGFRHGNRPLPSPALVSNAGSSPAVSTVCSIQSDADRTTPGVLPSAFGNVEIVLDRFPFVYLKGA